jgi:hypothetical protein
MARGPSPALTEWRRQLAAGERTTHTFDALWRAACAEAGAEEHERDGLPAIAASLRREAGRIVRTAARGVG